MKKLTFFTATIFAFILFFSTFDSQAQVRVGGGISIDINFPDVVVVGNEPRRRVPNPFPRPRRERRVYNHTSLGQITHQFRGNQDRNEVVNVDVFERRNGIIEVDAYLRSGDVLSFVLESYNINDYNYHFDSIGRGNSILEVSLNNRFLPIVDGNVSLQPKGRSGYNIVLNIHERGSSSYHGSFITL